MNAVGPKGCVDDRRGSPPATQAAHPTTAAPKSKTDGAEPGTRVSRVADRRDGRSSEKKGKEYPKPDPNLPYMPPADYKGGCWWCHRRALPDDHDYKKCAGRLAARAGYEKIKLAKARGQSQGPQGGH